MDSCFRQRCERAGKCLLAWFFLALAPSLARGQAGAVETVGPPLTPVKITADNITHWNDRNQQAFLLEGNVRIEQDTTRLQLSRGVLWIDDQTKGITNAYFLDIYGEDGVSLDQGGQKRDGPRGLFALTTRGRIELKSGSGQIPKQNLTQNATYTRAAQERGRIGELRAGGSNRPGPVVLGDIDPGPGSPPAPGGLQLVQGTAPAPGVAQPAPIPPVPGVPGPVPLTTPPQPQPPPQPPPFFGPPVTPPSPAPKGPGTASKADAPRKFSLRPRTAEELKINSDVTPTGETVYIVSTPAILMVTNPQDKLGVLDIEADRVVIWTRGDGRKQLENMRGPQGETTQHIEFYLAGDVVLRSETKTATEIVRADEVYYDVSRNVAIALKGDLELRQPKLPQPIHVRAPELFQLNSKLFMANSTEVFSTTLPSDPGLRLVVKNTVVEEREIERKTIFGMPILDSKTGEPKVDRQRYFTGRNMFIYFGDVPVFYFPYLAGDIEDPLGPLDQVGVGGDKIFGFRVQTTWDMYQLLGLERPKDARWRLYLDYLSERGPAAGTEYDFFGRDLLGMPSKYTGLVKAYGVNDSGKDILGFNRGQFDFIPPGTQIPITHPDWRGRFLSQVNVQDMPNGFTFQGQLSLISDRHFLEQYFQQEFINDYNQETFLYLKQQQDQWAWSVLAEPRLRPWMTETQWLPKADGYLLGQKLGEYFTWNVHGSAAFAQLRPTEYASFAVYPNDVRVDTGRFDLFSDLSLPLNAGPFKVVPYLVGDAALYTSDVNGDQLGRLYGGGGVRASVPFSRLYPQVQSDVFNLDSLYHKMAFSTNFLYAESSARYNRFPQLDRLNDDAADQALRDIFYRQMFINPKNATFLTTSPLVDPQVYAIRRLIDTRVDTLDRMDVVQFNWNQRLQTRRGIAATEHVVDWMTLDLGASLFPQASRDNFGESWGILEYDWLWNVGDRTALFSYGWFEPIPNGPRAFNVGTTLGRPDATNFTVSYRQIDPLQSRSINGSLTYAFSPKYAMTATTNWDFGTKQTNYMLGLTRIGTDLAMTLGISYNSVLENFGVQFEIVPNLLRSSRGPAGMGALSNGGFSGR